MSSDNPGHLYARFEALNGKQSFNLKLQRGNKAYMARKIMCSNGTLKVSVRSGNRIVAEQQIEHLVDDTLWLASNRDYRVTFTGRNASGNFDIKYRTK
ncbi:MAG: hypothetical protein J7539_05100 [Niabella sp.]|nr:hypothetical protein [Niabella sp.]